MDAHGRKSAERLTNMEMIAGFIAGAVAITLVLDFRSQIHLIRDDIRHSTSELRAMRKRQS